jgi:hypothetical protein
LELSQARVELAVVFGATVGTKRRETLGGFLKVGPRRLLTELDVFVGERVRQRRRAPRAGVPHGERHQIGVALSFNLHLVEEILLGNSEVKSVANAFGDRFELDETKLGVRLPLRVIRVRRREVEEIVDRLVVLEKQLRRRVVLLGAA